MSKLRTQVTAEIKQAQLHTGEGKSNPQVKKKKNLGIIDEILEFCMAGKYVRSKQSGKRRS